MKAEPGDKSINVTRADVSAAVTAVGVRKGDTVMFHSSLSSMGNVIGGADAVIDGFLDAVGPEGTVAVPTLWWHHTDPPMKFKDWDIRTSSSYVGLITETFRKRSDSVRSDNPSHSVSAIGRRAVELTRDHGKSGLRHSPWGMKAFSAESPWQRLYEGNAAYCFIGVDFTVNTMRHLIEAIFVEQLLAQAPPHKRPSLDARIVDFEKPGVWPNHSGKMMGERLAQRGLVKFGKIGSATLRCIRARDMVDNALKILAAEPQNWFKEDFLDWLREAKT